MSPPKIPSVPARTRRKGGVEGIPPRPSVPPERLPAEASAQAGSGGGQFRSKKVRISSNKHHFKTKSPVQCIERVKFYYFFMTVSINPLNNG